MIHVIYVFIILLLFLWGAKNLILYRDAEAELQKIHKHDHVDKRKMEVTLYMN